MFRVYNLITKKYWSVLFSTKEDAMESTSKGHDYRNRHLAVLNSGEVFEEVYIDFGNFCRMELGMQSQYGAHFVEGIGGSPNLSAGLRIVNPNNWSYHTYKIHKDDAVIFKNRVNSRW
jgi:hypothetical protein